MDDERPHDRGVVTPSSGRRRGFYYFKFHAFDWLNGEIHYLSYDAKGVLIDLMAQYWATDGAISEKFARNFVRLSKKKFDDTMTELAGIGVIKVENSCIIIPDMDEKILAKNDESNAKRTSQIERYNREHKEDSPQNSKETDKPLQTSVNIRGEENKEKINKEKINKKEGGGEGEDKKLTPSASCDANASRLEKIDWIITHYPVSTPVDDKHRNEIVQLMITIQKEEPYIKASKMLQYLGENVYGLLCLRNHMGDCFHFPAFSKYVEGRMIEKDPYVVAQSYCDYDQWDSLKGNIDQWLRDAIDDFRRISIWNSCK